MTDETQAETGSEAEESTTTNSKFAAMALRGEEYTESMEIDYYGMSGELHYSGINDEKFLPLAAELEQKAGVDVEEAQERLDAQNIEPGDVEDAADDLVDDESIDEEFIGLMREIAVLGIDRSQGIAEGESLEGLRDVLSRMKGGYTMAIAEAVLELTSNPDDAERFR